MESAYDLEKQRIFEAARTGNTSAIVSLIEKSSHVEDLLTDIESETAGTALHAAVEHGQLAAISTLSDILVGHKQKLPATPDREMTPLHMAAKRRRLDAVEVLVSKFPGDVDRTTLSMNEGRISAGMSALHLAVSVGEALLSHRASPNLKSGDMEETPLHFAARKGQIDTLNMLLVSGSQPDLRNIEGNHALHEACKVGQAGVVASLIAARCDLNMDWNSEGLSPLQYAARVGCIDIVRQILACASLRLPMLEKAQSVQIHWSITDAEKIRGMILKTLAARVARGEIDVEKEFSEACVADNSAKLQILLDEYPQACAQVNKRAQIARCATSGSMNSVRLLATQIDLADMEAWHRETSAFLTMHPVEIASKNGNSELLAFLFDLGAHAKFVNYQNGGRSPLHYACFGAHVETCSLLLRRGGADPNQLAADGYGGSPLQTTLDNRLGEGSVESRLAIARLLLEARADVTIKDQRGRCCWENSTQITCRGFRSICSELEVPGLDGIPDVEPEPLFLGLI